MANGCRSGKVLFYNHKGLGMSLMFYITQSPPCTTQMVVASSRSIFLHSL